MPKTRTISVHLQALKEDMANMEDDLKVLCRQMQAYHIPGASSSYCACSMCLGSIKPNPGGVESSRYVKRSVAKTC